MVPGTEAAHHALRVLVRCEPADFDLGPDADLEGARHALRILGESLASEGRVERVLDLTSDRIRREWPEPNPRRRGALIMLMLARGTARRHVPIGFDAEGLAGL